MTRSTRFERLDEEPGFLPFASSDTCEDSVRVFVAVRVIGGSGLLEVIDWSYMVHLRAHSLCHRLECRAVHR